MSDTLMQENQPASNPEATQAQGDNAPEAKQPPTEQEVADKLYDKEEGKPANGAEDPNQPEVKKVEEDKADAEGEKKDDDTKKGEDDKVEAFDLSDVEVELPEGMELNKDVLKELGELAPQLGVKTKEDAAKLVPLGVRLMENFQNKQVEQYKETRDGWRDSVKADKELGAADDKDFKAKIGVASQALDKFGTPELRKFLNETGLGDHPEIIRMMYRVGNAVKEDTIERGGSGDTVNPLDSLYPSMTKKDVS